MTKVEVVLDYSVRVMKLPTSLFSYLKEELDRKCLQSSNCVIQNKCYALTNSVGLFSVSFPVISLTDNALNVFGGAIEASKYMKASSAGVWCLDISENTSNGLISVGRTILEARVVFIDSEEKIIYSGDLDMEKAVKGCSSLNSESDHK